MKKLQTLMNEIATWSDATFGSRQRNPAILHHLEKEVKELIAEFYNDPPTLPGDRYYEKLDKVAMEYADCFMLLFDSAAHFGYTAEDIFTLISKKLSINKSRKWGKPTELGVVHHVKE